MQLCWLTKGSCRWRGWLEIPRQHGNIASDSCFSAHARPRAKHLHEEGLDRLPDEEIMAKALAEGAILLTTDLDFGELAIKSSSQLPSVIIFRLQPPMRAEKVNTFLVRVIQRHGLDLEQGALLSVSEKWIRVRRLSP